MGYTRDEEISALMRERDRYQKVVNHYDNRIKDLQESCPHKNIQERQIVTGWVKDCKDCYKENV
jgi:hypothetical protein